MLSRFVRDISARADTLSDRLATDSPGPVGPTALAAYEQVRLTRKSAQQLYDSPDLKRLDLLSNNVESLRRLAETLTLVEGFALAAKERFSSADAQVTDTLAKALRAADWPLDPPPVLLLSKEGYWSQPIFGLIYAPAAEDSTLLGMPDLAHELGHLLLGWNERELHLRLRDVVSRTLKALGPLGLAPKDVSLRSEAFAANWTLELGADAVAAYLFGPAFLWQHLRLSVRLGRNPYLPLLTTVSTHPAPKARFDGCAKLLTELGASLEHINDAWTELQARGRPVMPQYPAVYPPAVLAAVAEACVEACRARGIKPYTEAPADGLVSLTNQAWDRFRDTDDLAVWERDVLDRLLRRTATSRRAATKPGLAGA